MSLGRPSMRFRANSAGIRRRIVTSGRSTHGSLVRCRKRIGSFMRPSSRAPWYAYVESALRGLDGQVNAVALRPERFGHEATHRRLPRAIDTFERHEAGEHV